MADHLAINKLQKEHQVIRRSGEIMKKHHPFVFVSALLAIALAPIGYMSAGDIGKKEMSISKPSNVTSVTTLPAQTPEESFYIHASFTLEDIGKAKSVIHGDGFDLVPMSAEKWKTAAMTMKLADAAKLGDVHPIIDSQSPIIVKNNGKLRLWFTNKENGRRVWFELDRDHSTPDLFYVAIKTEKERGAKPAKAPEEATGQKASAKLNPNIKQ